VTIGARIVVLGGGISGLAFAHAMRGRADVTVLEKAPRAGGNLRTTRRDGYLIDDGGDSWVSNKPQATELARDLGLGDRLIGTIPENRRVYVVGRDGKLVPFPEGLTLGLPTRLRPVLRTPLLTWKGKARAALDLVLPVGFGRIEGEGGDESVGAWVERRFGREVVDALAGPLLGGLYTGDVSTLSMRASFPQLAALEKPGGVILAARRLARAAPTGPKASAFTSLRGSVGELVDALVSAIGPALRLGVEVRSLAREGTKWKVAVAEGEPLIADHVVLTGPAHVAAPLLAPHDAIAAETLASIPYGSAATVFLAFPREAVAHPLDATGYIVPASVRRHALASTWVSSKWEGRAPPGRVLMRVFFGGDDVERDDASLVSLAREEVRLRLGITVEPSLTHIGRFRRGSPQPRVGHPARMDRLRSRLVSLGGIHLLGSAYDGVGISDCVRQARSLALGIGGG
jgi:oxygen-dependent protoporphyrinogen oxidase